MDTGSGKTHIAILRMMAELDRCPPDKLIWFLTPSVALCEQQFRTIKTQMPAVRCKMLTGADGVEYWSEKRIWNTVLNGVQIMTSTPAILADALSHGFVTVNMLALLVLDEGIARHPQQSPLRL